MLTHHVCFRALCLLLGPFLAFRPPASSYFPYFLGPGCSELSQREPSNTNPTSLTSGVLESRTPAGWFMQRVKGAILESRTTKPNTHQVIPTSHVIPAVHCMQIYCTYLCSTDRGSWCPRLQSSDWAQVTAQLAAASRPQVTRGGGASWTGRVWLLVETCLLTRPDHGVVHGLLGFKSPFQAHPDTSHCISCSFLGFHAGAGLATCLASERAFRLR